MANVVSANLEDYFTVGPINSDVGSEMYRCKVCGKLTAALASDKAAKVRLLNHGLSHGGVLVELKPVK